MSNNKKLRLVTIFGVLYFIFILWSLLYGDFAEIGFLAFLGFIYTGFSTLSLKHPKQLIISSTILLILLLKAAYKNIPKLLLIDKPVNFYFFVVLFIVLQIFFLLHLRLKQYFIFSDTELIGKEIFFKKRFARLAVLIFIIVYLGLVFLISNKYINQPKRRGSLIPLENIKFKFGNGITAESAKSFLGKKVSFGVFNFDIRDKNNKTLCVFSLLHYYPAKNIIFGKAFETIVGSGEFYIAKAQMDKNGELKVFFPNNTKLIYEADEEVPVKQIDLLLIQLPYSFDELKLREDAG